MPDTPHQLAVLAAEEIAAHIAVSHKRVWTDEERPEAVKIMAEVINRAAHVGHFVEYMEFIRDRYAHLDHAGIRVEIGRFMRAALCRTNIKWKE